MAYGRYIKKKAKQATKAVGKRYGVSYGRKGVQMKKNSVAKIAKDLMWVKSRLNTEKKFVDTPIAIESTVGQVDLNAQGYYVNQIMPAIAQGTGEGNRVGNSIRATGMVLQGQFIKQADARGTRRLKVIVVQTRGDTLIGANDVVNDLIDENPLTTVRDYHSNIDYTEIKTGKYKILATRSITIPSNGGDTNLETEESASRCVKIPIKMSHVLRYETNGDNYPANTRFFVIVLADVGNKHTFNNSTIGGALVKAPLSGCILQMHQRLWYVDN